MTPNLTLSHLGRWRPGPAATLLGGLGVAGAALGAGDVLGAGFADAGAAWAGTGAAGVSVRDGDVNTGGAAGSCALTVKTPAAIKQPISIHTHTLFILIIRRESSPTPLKTARQFADPADFLHTKKGRRRHHSGGTR